MKCKSAGADSRDGAVACALNGREIRNWAATASLRERMGELGRKRLGKFALGDAVMIGQLAGRHIEGAEHDIEHREGRGKIPLAAALLGGVVPAVEHRAGDEVFERSQLPVEIG